jgi:hypothetical protein
MATKRKGGNQRETLADRWQADAEYRPTRRRKTERTPKRKSGR